MDEVTGKYSSGSDWTRKGKSYNEVGHVKTKLTSVAQHYAACSNDFAEYNKLRASWMNGRKEFDREKATEQEKELYDIQYNKDRRRELYSYLPETWVIIQIDNTGFHKISTARDFWSYHTL